jgi:hypothetical protein
MVEAVPLPKESLLPNYVKLGTAKGKGRRRSAAEEP